MAVGSTIGPSRCTLARQRHTNQRLCMCLSLFNCWPDGIRHDHPFARRLDRVMDQTMGQASGSK